MKFEIVSKVIVPNIGETKYKHMQEFDDNSNVFGRAYEYRAYMRRKFPGCSFQLVSATEIDDFDKNRRKLNAMPDNIEIDDEECLATGYVVKIDGEWCTEYVDSLGNFHYVETIVIQMS